MKTMFLTIFGIFVTVAGVISSWKEELENIRQAEMRLYRIEQKETEQEYDMFWTLISVGIVAGIGIAIFLAVRRLRK